MQEVRAAGQAGVEGTVGPAPCTETALVKPGSCGYTVWQWPRE
nr:MAG TPA: hypothetical protein [Caudoviricetes sp.]